jgi:SLBB domain
MRASIVFALLFLVAAPAVAQISDFERSRRNTAAYFNYAEQGDVTVNAHVWGAVRYPGYYEVPVGTKLSEILSIAGGPSFGERTRRSKRTVTIKLYRDSGAGRDVIYEKSATNGIDASGRDIQIMTGDVLEVQSVIKQGFSWRDLFSVIAALASVSLAVERLSSR